jgi:hypothetical protein
MQYRPTAAELLEAIADLLENEVLPVLDGSPVQHKVRVAGNLARILEREDRLGRESLDKERERLAALLGHDGEVEDLRRELTTRLAGGQEPDLEAQAWAVLVDITRDDLAIAKPGHDAWEGQ